MSDEDLGFEEELSGLGGTPSEGRGGRARKRRGGRGGLWLFLFGAIAGIAGTLLVPGFLRPYLPAAVRGAAEDVTGEVRAKRLDGERLLLTVDADQGAVLATFGKRVSEIDLLVEVGDTVTLGLSRYQPFVEDPVVRSVRKARASPTTPGAGADSAAVGDVSGEGSAETEAGYPPSAPPQEAPADTGGTDAAGEGQ